MACMDQAFEEGLGAVWRVGEPEPQKVATRPDDRAVARIAAARGGVIATRELAACGLNAQAVRVRVTRGHLHPVFRGVYAVGHPALTQTGLFTAAVLAGGDGASLAGRAAAALHGMRAWDGCDVDVIVRRSAGRRIDGIRSRRCRLDPADVWTRDNIRVTSPARTTLDLAAATPFKPLRRMVRQALAEQRVGVRQLLDVLHRHPCHRGAANLRAVVADGPVPTRSELEDLALDLLDGAASTAPR